ncbi:MAG: PKD domain-containing protein, partial [Flavobacteriales bacterium]
YTPSNTWSTINITFTPTFDVNTIILGSPCNLPPDYVTDPNGFNPYFFYDGLQLGEDVPYHAQIDQLVDAAIDPIDGSCSLVHTLTAHPDTLTGVYQWFQQGVALVGQTDTILDLAGNDLDPGIYQFYFFVDDTTCIVTTIDAQLPVVPGPEFTMDDPTGCEPHQVSFTNTTPSALPMTCEWDFGSVGTSATCDTTMSFPDPGTYDVTLTITYPHTCPLDTTYIAAVEVFEVPVASFTTDTLIGCIDLPVQLTNTSTGPVASGVYDFGDGFTGNTLNAGHTYTTAGVWDIELTVTSPDGCVDDTTMVALIQSVDAPTVLFTTDTLDGCSPLTVNFTNNTDPAYVGSCDWIFGDGGTAALCDPTYVYAIPGTYSVTLTVSTPWGCSGDTTLTDLITVYGHPVPTFTAEPDSGCYPLEVTFTNPTTGIVPDGCAWTFGDGGIGAPCDPVYTYEEPGVYDVSLRVTSPEGCLGDTLIQQVITVFDHPSASFTFGPQPTDVFEPDIFFVNASSQDVILWDWAFGPGGILGTDSVPDPMLTFPGEDRGEYPVTLIVTNANGCMDTTTLVVVIDGYFSVFVPNTFTPDGDGVNDMFLPVVKDQDPASHVFAVYDRWGERIFETSDAAEAWDGTLGGSKAKEDVYVWQVESTSVVDGKRRKFLGHVTLLR